MESPEKTRASRLKEILGKLFPGEKRVSIAKQLGFSEGAVRKWEKGASVDDRALAELAARGADIHYFLTGRAAHSTPAQSPSAAHITRVLAAAPESCPNRGACLIQARQLRLLVDIVELISCGDDTRVSAAIDEMQKALLLAVRRSGKTGQEPGAAGA